MTFLHEGIHIFAQGNFSERTFYQEGTFLHEDTFSRRDIFFTRLLPYFNLMKNAVRNVKNRQIVKLFTKLFNPY